MISAFLIYYIIENTISFNDVKPIFQQHCYTCHNSGYWDWTKYENAFKYKEQIKFRVWDTRTMPVGGIITEEEREKIRDWVNEGAKE